MLTLETFFFIVKNIFLKHVEPGEVNTARLRSGFNYIANYEASN